MSNKIEIIFNNMVYYSKKILFYGIMNIIQIIIKILTLVKVIFTVLIMKIDNINDLIEYIKFHFLDELKDKDKDNNENTDKDIDEFITFDDIITSDQNYFFKRIESRDSMTSSESSNLKREALQLLKHILPYNFDTIYLENKKKFKKYTNVCVLFTDIVSFCEIAKRFPPSIIYLMLNNMYSKFDNIIKKYKFLQKIETIGDAYMVVADLNSETAETLEDSVKEIIYFASEILSEIPNITTPSESVKLSIRVGIHIGPLVIGILGREIPRLCVIGHTVNMANRIQNNADPNTILISKELYDIVNKLNLNNIVFNIKKNVFLKNIGTEDTYTVSIINL
jgi:class 3 adenylate cyclase